MTTPPDPAAPPPPREPVPRSPGKGAPSPSLGEVVREWGRIGVIGFGGPPAHVALLRELTVDRRGWLTAREFEDANAATQLLPGPGSTQMAIYCAYHVAGRRGALAGGLAFVLPGLFVVLAIAAIALADRPPAWIQGIGDGAAAAVVAVVVQAGIALARSSVGGRSGGELARGALYALAGATAAVVVGPYVVAVLLAAGAIELALRRRGSPAAGVVAWPVAVALAAAGSAALPALAWTAFKVGALSYGGGFVVIPLMQGDAVGTHHWMTQAEYGNAVAYGQLTPGPVFHTVAFVGWAADGLGGALLAALIAFAPSFAVVLLGGRAFVALRESAAARTFLDGAGPAAVGAVLGAAWPLAQSLHTWWQWVVLAAAAAALLARAAPIWVLLGGACVGLVAAL